MISFKGVHYLKDVIVFAVFFYVRYGVSYRDLEEIMADRGVSVDQFSPVAFVQDSGVLERELWVDVWYRLQRGKVIWQLLENVSQVRAGENRLRYSPGVRPTIL